MRKTVVIGSGAGGGIAAMVRALAGDEVVVFEKGPWWRGRHFSDDEIKFGSRGMINQDPRIHPRTARIAGRDLDHGRILPSSQCVGGGTVHYAAMSFRFRPEDFAVLDAFGAVPGGNVANWPFSYDDLEPYYTRVEYLIGVQGLDAGETTTYRKRVGGLVSPLEIEANPALTARSKLTRCRPARERSTTCSSRKRRRTWASIPTRARSRSIPSSTARRSSGPATRRPASTRSSSAARSAARARNAACARVTAARSTPRTRPS